MSVGATPFDTDALSGLVDAIAHRVVELLDERTAATETQGRMVDVAQLAEILNISKDTAYRNSRALGAIRIGDGPRPALRFDVAKATAAWKTARCASAPSQEPAPRATTGRKAGRPRRAAGARTDLLPIRGGAVS